MERGTDLERRERDGERDRFREERERWREGSLQVGSIV